MNDPSSSSSLTQPQWHSIRPWRPILSLCVREITSVSATFILSSPFASSHGDGDGATNDGTDESGDTDEDIMEGDVVLEGGEGRRRNGGNGGGGGRGGQGMQRRHTQIVADALSKGLSVKVNGTPWQRVLMKVDDEADEAVIILFGLMPGRQYDVELGIVPGENSPLRSQITTELSLSQPVAENGTGAVDFSVNGEQQHLQQHFLAPTPPISSHHPPSNAPGAPPPTASTSTPTVPSFSLEDRRIQLTHTLALLTSEHATLTTTLKSARRDAQKADAALRAEIDVLKRATEKSAGQEHRARQKVLALQEAVRRSVAATEEVRGLISEVEGMLPGLEGRQREVEGEWARVRAEAKRVREHREEVEREERRRVEVMQGEMVNLNTRMEKLSVKREKLEGDGGVLSELEERLRKLEEERARVENDFEEDANVDAALDKSEDNLRNRRGSVDSRTGDSPPSDSQPLHIHLPGLPHHPHPVHNHYPRKRHSHPANSNSRTQQQHPIQRPSHNSRLSLPAGPGIIHLGNKTQGPQNPPAAATATSSTLSSRAPPFEPGRRPPLLPSHSSSGSANGVRSELNPGSSPFSPWSSGVMAGSQSMVGVPGSGKSAVAR